MDKTLIVIYHGEFGYEFAVNGNWIGCTSDPIRMQRWKLRIRPPEYWNITE